MSTRSHIIAMRFAAQLGVYIRALRLGEVAGFGAVTIGWLRPDIVAFPTVGWLPDEWERVSTWWLAVEVLRADRPGDDIATKRHAYLAFGVHEVWLVDAERETVTIVKRDVPDDNVRSHGMLAWLAPGARTALGIDLDDIFDG